MTSLYNLFTKHNMDPDWVMTGTSDMGRKLLFAFSSYEVEQEAEAKKKSDRSSRRNKRGGR